MKIIQMEMRIVGRMMWLCDLFLIGVLQVVMFVFLVVGINFCQYCYDFFQCLCKWCIKCIGDLVVFCNVGSDIFLYFFVCVLIFDVCWGVLFVVKGSDNVRFLYVNIV